MSKVVLFFAHMVVGGFCLFVALLPHDGSTFHIVLSYANFAMFIANMTMAGLVLKRALQEARDQ